MSKEELYTLNFNLSTTSLRRAKDIALDVCCSNQNAMRPGTLKNAEATGTYNKEHDITQVSVTISDLSTTPLHIAFETICQSARNRGIRLTGTEIVTPIPKRALIETGKYFLEKQHRSTGMDVRGMLPQYARHHDSLHRG